MVANHQEASFDEVAVYYALACASPLLFTHQ
jgi:hypothetical protein